MAVYDRVLITGGGGFVGTRLREGLRAAFPNAQYVDISRTGRSDGPGWRGVAVDLCDEARVDAVVADFAPQLVVHLAAQSSIGAATHAGEASWRTNFFGTFHLAAAVARHAPEATFFFSSSAAVYGASLNDGVVDETTPPRPLDAYSRSKYASEAALVDVLPASARLIVVRPVNHSGAGQASRNFALASFAAQIVAIERGESEPRIAVGDLSKARDFLDVRDVVSAYVGLLRNADRLEDRHACFNVASGRAETLAHLLDTMRAHALRPFEVEVDPKLIRPAKVDIPTMACDASRLRAAIGWEPRHSAEDMVVDLLSFWRELGARSA